MTPPGSERILEEYEDRSGRSALPRTPVLLVGASVRAIAQAAIRSGYQPIAVDLFGDSDLADACASRVLAAADYPNGFPDLAAEFSGVPIVYTGGLENYPRVLESLAERHPILGNSASVVRQVRDPFRLAGVLDHQLCRVPPIRDSADGLPRDGAWLRKSMDSCGGLGVQSWIPGTVEQTERLAGTYFQKRIPGANCSAVFVANGSQCRWLASTRQLIGEPWLHADEFCYAGTVGPLAMNGDTRNLLEWLGNRLAQGFRLCGLFGVDYLENDEGIWVVDVNPRYSASMEILERALGAPLFHWHVRACHGNPPGPLPPAIQTAVYGKGILYAREDLGIGLETSRRMAALALSQVWPDLADIPNPGTTIARGQPICTVFSMGATEADCEVLLRERVAALEAWLYDGGRPSTFPMTLGTESDPFHAARHY